MIVVRWPVIDHPSTFSEHQSSLNDHRSSNNDHQPTMNMNSKWTRLYEAMQAEIDGCLATGGCLLELHEQCFHISMNNWALLKTHVTGNNFKSVDEEIDFYKRIKPLFLSSLEFHSLVVHSLTFKPDDHYSSEIIRFWQRQMSKYEKFFSANSLLCEYYISGRTDMDAHYFRSEMNDSLDNRDDFRTSENLRPSKVISVLLALERYKEHARGELMQYEIKV